MQDIGWIVPRACAVDSSRPVVEYAIENRYEHGIYIRPTEQPVHFRQAFARAFGGLCYRTYEGATNGHEQRCRHSFARHVGDDKPDTVVPQPEKVVEIASDLLSRRHRCIDIQILDFREGREGARQDSLLNLPGERQVRLYGLQLLVLALALLGVVYLLDSLLDCLRQVLHIDGLGCEVEGSPVHCRADVLHIPVCRYHDTFLCRVPTFVDLR